MSVKNLNESTKFYKTLGFTERISWGTPPTVKKHGGKFLTRGETVTTLEGEPYTDRMVILEFPTKKHVEEWLADPEYQAAAEYRKASSTMGRLLVQEGGMNTENPDPKL